MEADITEQMNLEPQTRAFYCDALKTLQSSGVPVMIGGAFAFGTYTGIARHTKDFDVFVRQSDAERALAALAGVGYSTEMTFPHWLGKAYKDDLFVDVIFSSSNGVSSVDDVWLERAPETMLFDMSVKLCPPEEMIWQKALIQERERYDGADVAHLIRALGTRLDWPHLLQRFGSNWPVLLSHLILFRFIYPTERENVPQWVMNELLDMERMEHDAPTADHICRGTLLSRQQYLPDLKNWGYADARQQPFGTLTAAQIAQWTDAIGKKE